MSKTYGQNTGIHTNTVNPKKRRPSWTGKKESKRPVGFILTLRLKEREHVKAFDAALAKKGYGSRSEWFKEQVEKLTGLDLSGEEEE